MSVDKYCIYRYKNIYFKLTPTPYKSPLSIQISPRGVSTKNPLLIDRYHFYILFIFLSIIEGA